MKINFIFLVTLLSAKLAFGQFSSNNLLFWLRSDTSITLSGQNVLAWNDISGNNFNFTSVLPPTIPLDNINNINNIYPIYFNNSNLISTNAISINDFNAFIVYKKRGAINAYERILEQDFATGFWIGRNSTNPNNFGSGYKNTSPPYGIYSTFFDTLVNIILVKKENNIYKLYNGFNLLSSQTLTDASPTNSNKLILGSDNQGTGMFSGDMFEVIFFNSAITATKSDSIINYLYNKYAPPINLGNDIICDSTIIPINLNGCKCQYLWSTGAITSSITVHQSGKYWVNATNVFGKISSDTINVIYPQVRKFSSINDTSICSSNSILLHWNTNLPKNQFSFQWQDNSTDSLFVITTPGQYYVKVSDMGGCSLNSSTVTVAQDNFSTTASLGPDVSLCAGNSIALTSGSLSASTYTWSDGSHSNSLLINTTGSYSVAVTNTNSCVAKDTINVTILGQLPVANFTTSVGCKNSQVTFSNLSTPASGNSIVSNSWNFGDALSASNTSTLSNPFHTFSDTGNYVVKLTVMTNVGCSQTITKVIHIAPTPTVNLYYGIARQNDSTSFSSTIVNTLPYQTASILWDFGDPLSGSSNSSGLSMPKHLFNTVATYSVKLTVINNAGCKDSVIKTVNVLPQSTFFPFDYSGLKLWLTGDSVQKTVPPLVDKCFDLSGNFNNSIQNVNSKSPTSIASNLNNHKVLRLDGIDDFMSFSSIDSIRTCFFVVKHGSGLSTDYPPLLGHSSSYDFIGGKGNLLFDSSVSSFISGGIVRVNTFTVAPLAALKPTNYSILSIASSGFLRAEYITNDRNVAAYWNGDYAEIIIYNKQLNPTQVAQVEQYLNDKYAPPIFLPNDITITNSYCDTLIKPINPNNNQYTYQWSTGATTPTISVNKTGKYWVKATNVFGKISSDTIQVSFPNYNSPTQTSICQGNTMKWNTSLSKNKFTFQWQDNSTDSVLTITQAGNYYVKISDNFGCSIMTNTLTISQDNFSTTASLGPDVSLCAGNSIALTSGSLSASTYTWSDGSHSNSLLINTTGSYSVAVTNTNSCIAKDTINVTVLGQAPVSNFTTSVGCKNSQVTFSNLSTPPSGNTITSHLWDFGDPLSGSNTSTLTNPSHTYTNTGTYTISLKVTTNTGCSQTITKTLTVYPTPTVNFSNGISCQNDSTSFSNLSISSNGYSVTTVNWNFGDAISGAANASSLFNPKHLFSNQISYAVTLIATNNVGCKDSISKNIVVKAQVKSAFSYSTACTNEAMTFQDNSIVPAPNSTNVRNWSFGSSTATGTLVSHSYTLAGTYSVGLTVLGNNGCTSTTVKQVTVTLPPTPIFVSPSYFCINDSIKLTDASIGNPNAIQYWKWSVNTNTYSTIQSPYLHVSDTGNHVIKLKVTDVLGCRDSINKNIYTYPLPMVDFVTNPNFIYSNTSATLTPNILSGLSYSWTGSNNFSSSLISPSYQFLDTGTYQITLLLKNNYGCVNSKTKSFNVFHKKTDLVLLDIIPIVQSDGFLDLTAKLGNFGTTTITDFKINYKLTNGGQIKENWTGILNSGTLYNYHFLGSSLVNEADRNSIVCVTISQVNGGVDDNIQNDNQCVAMFVTETDVFSPYPNPTSSNIIFPIVLKKETPLSINVINNLGESVLVNNSMIGNPGLNLVPLSISSLYNGSYVVKITINDKVFVKKIVKY